MEFPADLTKGRSRQPHYGGLYKDFAPTVVGNKAGEAIGWAGSGYDPAVDYPKAPVVKTFTMLYQSGDREVKAMILGSSATDMTYAKLYAGFTETAVRDGYACTCRVAGQVYIPIGADGTISAGDFVVPCFDNSGDNVAGDIRTYDDPAGSDTPATDNKHFASMIVGRATKGGAARTDDDTFDTALVTLRGF